MPVPLALVYSFKACTHCRLKSQSTPNVRYTRHIYYWLQTNTWIGIASFYSQKHGSIMSPSRIISSGSKTDGWTDSHYQHILSLALQSIKIYFSDRKWPTCFCQWIINLYSQPWLMGSMGGFILPMWSHGADPPFRSSMAGFSLASLLHGSMWSSMWNL